MTPVLAFAPYHSNAELIEACARLGYLRDDWITLDPTYGYGTFWKKWRPHVLLWTDLSPDKSLIGSVSFTRLPWTDRAIPSVVFDPPYKLNGTPTRDPGGMDERFGVDNPTTWQDRMALCKRGITECARVLGDGYLLVKCMDQVVSGHVVWQTDEFTEEARLAGLVKVDRLDLVQPSGGRPQPEGRRQVHARRNASSMLVFKRQQARAPRAVSLAA